MPAGRPSDYLKKRDELLRRIASGRTLTSVCRDEDMPDKSTVWAWLQAHPEFPNLYAAAKEKHADSLADEILDIADQTLQDDILDEEGNAKPNHEWINRSKLRVDARKWLLSKILPKKYGDKVEQTIVGDPDKPVHTKTELDISKASTDDLMTLLQGIIRPQ